MRTILWYNITRYASIILVTLLFLWELHEIILDFKKKKPFSYLKSLSNYLDWIIICTAASFLVFWENNIEVGCDLLGWTLFYVYLDLTLHLAHHHWIGQYIYMALSIMKTMCLALVIFTPILCAFAFAFHSFNFGASIFETSIKAFGKTMIMLPITKKMKSKI